MDAKHPQWEKLLRKYNAVFAEACDRILNKSDIFSGLSIENHEQALLNAVYNSVQGWQQQPMDDAPDSPTGDEIIGQIDSPDLAMDFLRYAAEVCDHDLPDIIKIRFSAFGQPLIDRLISAVMAADFVKTDDQSDETAAEALIIAVYLKLLGDWQVSACVDDILTKFRAAGEPDDLIADAVRYYLLAVGEPAIPSLLNHLDRTLAQQRDLDTAGEYMLIALTDLGKESPAAEIFAMLRSAFRQMSHKAIGAICLGDYGDGRGIPVLKGWLDRNPAFQDNQTISEILSAIKRLGGEIDDIRHRLRLDRR